MTANNTPNPTQAPDMAVEAIERQNFEDACAALGSRPVRDATDNREYVSTWDDIAWSGWKMRAALARPQEVAGVTEAEVELLELISELEDAAADNGHEMSERTQLDRLVACRLKVSGAVRLLSSFSASRAPVAVGVEPVTLSCKACGRIEAHYHMTGADGALKTSVLPRVAQIWRDQGAKVTAYPPSSFVDGIIRDASKPVAVTKGVQS